MSQLTMNIIMLSAMVFVCVCSIVILVVVIRLFVMHNVKNEDGSYAWMTPDKWLEIQGRMSDTQDRIAMSMSELSEYNAKQLKLMQSLVDATLSMHQEIKNGRGQEQ